MDAVILQENIEGLLNLVRMLLPGGGVQAACIWMTFPPYNDPSTNR